MTTIHSVQYSCILFYNIWRMKEQQWSNLQVPESTAVWMQPIWENLGASARMSVAVRSCWVVQLWLPINFTFCWWLMTSVHWIQAISSTTYDCQKVPSVTLAVPTDIQDGLSHTQYAAHIVSVLMFTVLWIIISACTDNSTEIGPQKRMIS